MEMGIELELELELEMEMQQADSLTKQLLPALFTLAYSTFAMAPFFFTGTATLLLLKNADFIKISPADQTEICHAMINFPNPYDPQCHLAVYF